MKTLKKVIVGLLISAGILGISGLLKSSEILLSQQLSLSNLLYRERGASSEIVIVALDDFSMQEQEAGGLGALQSWTRAYYAQVLDTIEAGEPTAALFDLLFLGESLSESTDNAFAQVLAKYDNDYIVKSAAGEKQLEGDVFHYETSIEPLSSLAEASQMGFFNIVSEEESANRSTLYAIPAYIAIGEAPAEEHVDLLLARDQLDLKSEFEMPLEKGQMLINYAAPPYSFPMVSFADVYFGRVDPNEFKGKLVLIGATAPILKDFYYTPIDEKTPMSGIEIHANAIQTILDEAYLRYQNPAGFLGLIGVITLASVFVFLYAPILWGALFGIAEIVGFPFYAQWRFNQGVIPELIWPIFAMLAAYLSVLAYRNFTEFTEKRKLKTAFSHYVSPELVQQITEKPEMLKLGGERRKLTVLFLDLENFTFFSEKLTPQEVVKILNVYFDALATVIMAQGGMVDKFEGDAIMALFGAPIPSEDHAEKACLTALLLQAKIQELNAQMGYSLNIRIGLATGEAIVGNMGSTQRFDYTAIGDTVNTASRLENANRFYNTRILTNPGTFEAAQEKLSFRHVDTVCLKGKAQAMHIYEALGTTEAMTEQGKTFLKDWGEALSTYQKGDWDAAKQALEALLSKLPNDGPTQTLLNRIKTLQQAPKDWDGVWRFEEK